VRRMKLTVIVASPGSVRVVAPPSTRRKKRHGRAPSLKPSTASGGAGRILVRLRLAKPARAALKQKGVVHLRARVTFTPTGGDARTKSARLTVKAARRKRR
jgi:hypothetical protein